MPLDETLAAAVDAASFAHLATVMRDGSPHVSVVWIERDGDRLTFNTAEGRVKAVNVRRDPRVAFSISPPDDPYMNIAVRGRVIDITTEAADEQIDRLASKYLGLDEYPWREPGQVRLKVVVAVAGAASNR
ncbi:MAG: PPOX class F420-dependent oxidoreductase [Acidimicrobiia bacterium]